MRFCNHCGQPETSGPLCAHAQWVSDETVEMEVGVLRCPVEGCQYRQSILEQSAEKARQVFAYHLAWHMEHPKPPREPPPAPVPEGGTDWDAWAATLEPVLQHLSANDRAVVRVFVARCMRALEGAQW